MNKTDINLITEAYGQVNEMGLKKTPVADTANQLDYEPSEYGNSSIETQAENAIQAFLHNVDESDDFRRSRNNPFEGQRSVPLKGLPKELKLKVIETWINKLKDYHRMVKIEGSAGRTWED